MDEIFSRNVLYWGEDAQNKIASSHIAVFGLGGVGGFCAEAIARSGVGELTLVDFDKVSKSNINRQIVALNSSVGMFKTELFEKRLKDINPDIKLHLINDFYQEINSSLEKQRLLEMQPLNNDYQNIIDHCTTLLLQENPDLASDSLNKFLEDDLQFNQGKWIKDELNLFNTSEANYISKQLDKISIDSLSAYTKTKTIGISTPDWNIEL